MAQIQAGSTVDAGLAVAVCLAGATPKTAPKAKTVKAKLPVAGPWLRAVCLVDAEGFAKGELIVVRKSRTGGWRLLSPNRCTAIVGDKHITKWVLALRTAEGKVIAAPDQAGMDKALQGAFAEGWKRAPGVKQA